MARLEELRKACEWIGFELQQIGEQGLEKVTLPTGWKNRTLDTKGWPTFGNLRKMESDAPLFPNSHDWNQTHLGVHLLTLDALRNQRDFNPFLVETEYWGQMPAPNLLVESSTEEVADLLGALSHHEGELKEIPSSADAFLDAGQCP